MTGKENCYDDAMVETFFKTLKSEVVWRMVVDTPVDATKTIRGYIDQVLQSNTASLSSGF
jgi:putative transposase